MVDFLLLSIVYLSLDEEVSGDVLGLLRSRSISGLLVKTGSDRALSVTGILKLSGEMSMADR